MKLNKTKQNETNQKKQNKTKNNVKLIEDLNYIQKK
jgi:hypothetical protein